MLIGALTAVIVSAYAPWYIGVLAGLAAGGFLGGVMALFHLRFKADIILVGFAINIIAAGGTVTVLTYATGGDKGTSINIPSKAIPALDLSFLGNIPAIGPFLREMLSGHSYLTWLAAFMVYAIWYFLYRTPEGLRFRAVGEYPPAAEAAGIAPNRLRTYGLIASGALAGLGGAQLAMFSFVGFTRDMTAGRGFIALGAVLLGKRHPIGTMIAAVLFGFFEALSIALPGILRGAGRDDPHDPVRRDRAGADAVVEAQGNGIRDKHRPFLPLPASRERAGVRVFASLPPLRRFSTVSMQSLCRYRA